jgi:hypothetical protein
MHGHGEQKADGWPWRLPPVRTPVGICDINRGAQPFRHPRLARHQDVVKRKAQDKTGKKGCLGFNVTLFHLVNHAFFKALLFLPAGFVIHAMADQQDLRRRLGGLANFLPLTNMQF